MIEALSHPPPSPHRRQGAWRLRALALKARQAQLSGGALLGAGVALTVAGLATLAWSGIVTGAPRFILLVLAAAILRGRLLSMRLGAMMPADGIAALPLPGVVRRWTSLGEGVALLLAAGLGAYGSHSRIALPIAGATAVLLLFTGLRGSRQPARAHPTTLLALSCLAAAVEPLWGWRGQSLVIGLCVVAAALSVQLLAGPRRTADLPSAPGPDAG
jgi:hypothetical protein